MNKPRFILRGWHELEGLDRSDRCSTVMPTLGTKSKRNGYEFAIASVGCTTNHI